MPSVNRFKYTGKFHVVVSIAGAQNLSARALRRDGADMIELRLDRFHSLSPRDLSALIKKARALPLLATIRSRREGGSWQGSENQRLALFKQVLPVVDAVDIELSSARIRSALVRAARQRKKTVIISYHNFKATPSLQVLNKIIRRAVASGADMIKIAAQVKSDSDLRRLGSLLLQNQAKPLAIIGMGKKGQVSRVLFPLVGSALTYAHIGRATAPGQMSLTTLKQRLKRLTA